MIPDLAQSLVGQDLHHLELVAELWGIEFDAPDFKQGLVTLIPLLLGPELLEETLEVLPEKAQLAFQALVQNDDRMPWALFTRRFGEVRKMGRSRRDRELPYRNPSSPAEVLWYRALIGRAFFDTPAGPEEFAYIPRDLSAVLSRLNKIPHDREADNGVGHAVRLEAGQQVSLATDRILDDACTLLAGLRTGLDEGTIAPHLSIPIDPLKALLLAAGLLDEQDLPLPTETREFLEGPRGEGLGALARSWRSSPVFSELRLIPGLQVEGEWEFDPRRGREVILSFLARVPGDTWWSLPSFVEAIRREDPDFQRPAGDYDTWFIRQAGSERYLRGIESWDEVDGAMVQYLVCGPLHWLGILDLASSEESPEPQYFRLSAWAESLLMGGTPSGISSETGVVSVRSDGKISVPTLAPRAVRYQIARFCAWDDERQGTYRYRLTGRALEHARKEGLRAAGLLALLVKTTENIPPNIPRAIERWETGGPAGEFEQVTILRLASPDILKALRKSRAARFLGDPLSPTTVIVKEGARSKVLEVLAELGYLGWDQ